MSIIGIILLSIFIFTYRVRNYWENEEQEKEYICPICGKIMGQGETDWEDNIEVWVNCSHCGFQSSSRYYYDQYCAENNEEKKSVIIKNLKNYLNK